MGPKTSIRSLAACACLAVGLAGPTAAAEPGVPLPRDQAALLHDLEKIVEAKESGGWQIDRYEYDEMMPDALESTCAVPVAARAALLARLDARVRDLGGPVEKAFVERGRDLDAVDELLFATRVRNLLAEAMRRAPAECPFWVVPSPRFRGVQSDAHRFTVNLETDGILLVRHFAGALTVGGGGSGRLLLGRGLDPRWSLLVGGEFGGGALFEQSQPRAGSASAPLPLTFTAAVPFVIRKHDLTWHYEAELAPIAYFEQRDTHVSWGGRAGILVGKSGLRFRGIMPWAGIGLAFEYVLADSVRPASWSIKGGARLGFDWDF